MKKACYMIASYKAQRFIFSKGHTNQVNMNKLDMLNLTCRQLPKSTLQKNLLCKAKTASEKESDKEQLPLPSQRNENTPQ